MRKMFFVFLAVTCAAPALAQPQTDLTSKQRYNYWTRCAAMFDIVGKGKRDNANLPDADKYDTASRQARDNSFKEAQSLNVSREAAENDIRDMTQSFSETLARGDKATEAAFGTAIEICASALMPTN